MPKMSRYWLYSSFEGLGKGENWTNLCRGWNVRLNNTHRMGSNKKGPSRHGESNQFERELMWGRSARVVIRASERKESGRNREIGIRFRPASRTAFAAVLSEMSVKVGAGFEHDQQQQRSLGRS
jgi:hypothetical protein